LTLWVIVGTGYWTTHKYADIKVGDSSTFLHVGQCGGKHLHDWQLRRTYVKMLSPTLIHVEEGTGIADFDVSVFMCRPVLTITHSVKALLYLVHDFSELFRAFRILPLKIILDEEGKVWRAAARYSSSSGVPIRCFLTSSPNVTGVVSDGSH